MAVVQSVPSPRARLGAWGEQHAAERLAELGWQIVARNWRGSCGELDLIALEPTCCLTLARSLDEARAADGRPFGPALNLGQKAMESGLRSSASATTSPAATPCACRPLATAAALAPSCAPRWSFSPP